MAESLSNVFNKNLFRHYFNFERVNLNFEYHLQLITDRQWKKQRPCFLNESPLPLIVNIHLPLSFAGKDFLKTAKL